MSTIKIEHTFKAEYSREDIIRLIQEDLKKQNLKGENFQFDVTTAPNDDIFDRYGDTWIFDKVRVKGNK